MKKVEIINSREKDDIVQILKLFTNVETVTRVFSLTYKNAITEVLPNAKQIVDRFHILKNLTNYLCNYLKRIVSDRIKLYKDTDSSYEDVLTRRQQDKIDTANRKWKIIQEEKQLYQDGNTKTYIAEKLGITRSTLNVYLSLEEPPVKDSNCILDNYISLIKELIIEGKKTKEIFEEMKENGYKGKLIVLNMHMGSIKNENLKQDIVFYLNQNKELSEIIDLEREFKIILFSKNQNNQNYGQRKQDI